MEKDIEPLEFLRYILGCDYISDLRIEPYNTKAKLLLNNLGIRQYSLNQIHKAIEYIYFKNKL